MDCKYWISMESEEGGEINIEKMATIDFLPYEGLNIFIDDWDTTIEYVSYDAEEKLIELNLDHPTKFKTYEELKYQASCWVEDGWCITDEIPPKSTEKQG